MKKIIVVLGITAIGFMDSAHASDQYRYFEEEQGYHGGVNQVSQVTGEESPQNRSFEEEQGYHGGINPVPQVTDEESSQKIKMSPEQETIFIEFEALKDKVKNFIEDDKIRLSYERVDEIRSSLGKFLENKGFLKAPCLKRELTDLLNTVFNKVAYEPFSNVDAEEREDARKILEAIPQKIVNDYK